MSIPGNGACLMSFEVCLSHVAQLNIMAKGLAFTAACN